MESRVFAASSLDVVKRNQGFILKCKSWLHLQLPHGLLGDVIEECLQYGCYLFIQVSS